MTADKRTGKVPSGPDIWDRLGAFFIEQGPLPAVAIITIAVAIIHARRANDPPERPRRAADPGDDYLIGLAEAERAVLVSGDRDLLELADRFPIHAARTFLDSLG